MQLPPFSHACAHSAISQRSPAQPFSHVHVFGSVQLPMPPASTGSPTLREHGAAPVMPQHTGLRQSSPVHPGAHSHTPGAAHVPLLKHPRLTVSTHSPPLSSHRPIAIVRTSLWLVTGRYDADVSVTSVPTSSDRTSRALDGLSLHTRRYCGVHLPLVQELKGQMIFQRC